MFKQRKGAERVLKAQLCEHSPSADTADLPRVVWSSTVCSPWPESSTAAPAPPPSSLSVELTLLGEMRPMIPDGAPPSPPHAAHAVSAPPSPVRRESERRTHTRTDARTHARDEIWQVSKEIIMTVKFNFLCMTLGCALLTADPRATNCLQRNSLRAHVAARSLTCV
jgi:hypothetical protein